MQRDRRTVAARRSTNRSTCCSPRSPTDGGDEVELGDDSIDVVFHDGAAIDLGETAAETMALALDPFPRGPGADAALQAGRGRAARARAGPFGALAALLKKD